ncbi:MAG: response regulator [Alphaproteobacteria bacterium]|nr:response regulator [Alphaproteobacteria bacterium]MBU0793461.1 response regulator [Alphaproteobacteria bacterium]MBU0877069.1 response regulator [Alphaproteobacteria bacterium]MBU1770915.1 response regulator [Alphaproteobacteria bacterium]
MIMTGTHDNVLVILSIAIAMFASFTALSLASRTLASTGWARRVWLSSAALALGGGVWSMHFVAMLAFSMPGMPTSYDLSQTLLSLLIALIFTGAGFSVLNWQTLRLRWLITAGLLMGAGIVTMHYVGMAAMRMPATVSYEPIWFSISVVTAVCAATAALWLASREQKLGYRVGAAAVMGAAIADMHYAGMRAAVFRAHESVDRAVGGASVGQTYLAILISAVTVLILVMALGAAWLERLFQGMARREARTALRLKIADALRAKSTNEALHEAAALMGEHFGVSRTGYGQLDPIEDVFDYDVCWSDGRVPPLLGQYPASAFGVKIVAALNAGQTVVVEDIFHADLSDEERTRDTAREVDTRSILVVPFVRDGRLRTIVYLNDNKPRKWRPDEVAFMEEIAERTRLVIERAEVERQLRELNATLEARVEVRTAELRDAQEALLQSQKMEAVGQLVSGLAHDFNNVLGAIVGSFELIERRADDPERARRFARAGMQAAERGAKLTAQLLTFSRSQRIQLQPLYVCDILEPLRDMLARTLGPMIALDFQLNQNPAPVLADATQIEMMVLNLAINARDAMPDGGSLHIATSTVLIEEDHELAPGNYVQISVRDTGVGMDAPTLQRAMEPFFTTKPVGKGTGLGLAQIYGSARQAGGTARISSSPGEGTTVFVLLPCTDRQPEPRSNSVAPPPHQGGEHARVLLVDDDHDLRNLLASALESQGYQVKEAADGTAALAMLDAETADIAVIDFAMPGMNGAELSLRIADRSPSLPILFISGFADTAALESAAGADVIVLRKPFRIDEFLHAVDARLREART